MIWSEWKAWKEWNDGVGTVPYAYGWVKYSAGTVGRYWAEMMRANAFCLGACNFRSTTTTTLYSRLSKVVASINERSLASNDA